MLYSAFFRGEKHEDGYMVRVEADNLVDAARIAEETRNENGVREDLDLSLVTVGYGSPSMF